MERRPLREIPNSSSNVPNFGWSWDSNKVSDLLFGMGVSPMEKDPQDTENTPQDQIIKMTPHKRQRLKERDDVFVIARRPRLSRPPQPVISWDALPDELLLDIFSYFHLSELLIVSRVCKRWRRLSSDESLWQSLDLADKHLADGVTGRLLSLGVVLFRCPRSCIGEPLFKNTRNLRLQHADLSNCTISVAALHSILLRCHKLQNLSVEGLLLSDDIMRSIARNSDLERLNIGGCSGFSAETLKEVLINCPRLDELNISWCDFTMDHIKVLVDHIPSSVTQLNISGYRQNLEISDVSSLVTSCPRLTSLDLSDSVLLTSECFPVLKQLTNLQHLALSRCYQICPANLLELGQNTALKTLAVFGIVTDNSLPLLKESLPHIKINCSFFNTVGRATTGLKKSRSIWGMKCKLSLNRLDTL